MENNNNSSSSSTVLPSSQNNQQVLWSTQVQKSSENKTIVYQSAIMGSLMKMIDRVAPSNANILVLGESGTGKELVARYIHEKS
ncbi:MAG TPA: sigma 54-interacting transcriptional regulator, partial [Pseudobdellovibrionaceae bacterium]